MSAAPKTLVPEIYVLWHPECALGEPLAQRILRWLRPGNGFGPDVFYRSLPAPGKKLPPGLPNDRPDANHERPGFKDRVDLQIVVLLADRHMVADYGWRRWLEDHAPKSGSNVDRRFLPVALDATAYNLPDGLRKLNFLRPADLPLPDGWKKSDPSFEKVARSLLKQVTEALCRELLPRAERDGALPKINVFLSHAKQDGVRPASRLRDYIYSRTQLAAFFDENDIAFGSDFGNVIDQRFANDETAALIAVRSARYVARPWCRREFSLFRRPRALQHRPRNWRLYPALVVEAMDGREPSYGVPEMGNCPMIRWNESDSDIEELVITTLIRDALLAAVHGAIAESMDMQDHQLTINWLPDPTTLLHIPVLREQATHVEVLYPGRGVSSLELSALGEFFPRARFTAFEQVQ